MNHSPFVIVSATGLAALILGQIWLPTVKAQPKPIPNFGTRHYFARIEGMQTRRTAGGLEVTGRIVNTGRQTLTYTSVVPVLLDDTGKEIGRGTGYLTTGPVGPGQTAEFRASEPIPPRFAHVQITLRERGMLVMLRR